MCHRLELVVDEELGGHHDESKGEEEAIAGSEDKAVPTLVLIINDRVDTVAEGEREEDHSQVSEGHPTK